MLTYSALTRFVRSSIAAGLILALGGCGGSGGESPSPPAASSSVTVNISPGAVTVNVGGTQTFTTTVGNSTDTTVAYSVQEGTAGGSISAMGEYVAPQTEGTYHVVATSNADSTKSAMATVTVMPTIAITPKAVTIVPGGTQTFVAVVTGSSNTGVTFLVVEGAAGGTITSSGDYAAPATAGLFHVTVVSSANPDVSATASVNVWPAGPVTTPTGNMLRERGRFTATLLGNGKVLVTGGDIDSSGDWDYGGIADAELYDPATGSFAATGLVNDPRHSHAATLLPNGKVLLTGGIATGGQANSSAELYDPVSGTFTGTGNMTAARAGHTATLLPGGMVLITGGVSTVNGDPLSTAEIYDSSTGTFTAIADSMLAPRYSHTATLLANGKVLIVGGLGRDYFDYYAVQAELYDAVTGKFSGLTGETINVRYNHTATLFSGGTKVLITGGSTYNRGGSGTPAPALDLAEVYDSATDSLTTVGSMNLARSEHTATLLNSGLANELVLVTGGSDSSGDATTTMELFDPSTGTFLTSGAMHDARSAHTATLLGNGELLLAGGEQSGATAELYP